MSSFSDHFSGCADAYAAYRPVYPPTLIEQLAALAPARELAWDAGTGNGQAAALLAAHFARVLATDASAEQIARTRPQPRIRYRVCAEDGTGLDEECVDLVTVAQALHWFDLDRFHAEVRRVLKPGGVVAAWCYGRIELEPPIGPIVDRFYFDRIGAFWPAERRHVERGYVDLPFPFESLPFGSWSMAEDLTVDRLMGYVGTWSAVKECRLREGRDPLPDLRRELEHAWPAGVSLRAVWPLAIRVGRKSR